MSRILRFTLLFACLSTAQAADFNFNVLIRAGLLGSGDWEVGLGLNSGGVPTVSGQLAPYYLDAQPQRFEIGYRQSTGQAFVRLYGDDTNSVLLLNVLYSVPNAAPLTRTGSWTLPANSFYTSATLNPQASTGVSVSNLSLSTGLAILNPASLTAVNDTTSGQRATQSAPTIFQTASGDWMLSGSLTMTGLRAYVPNGATRSQLQFGLTAQASDTPEPAAWLTMASAALVLYRLPRRARHANAAPPSASKLPVDASGIASGVKT